eukprot:TRINITY_DN22490_c0_g2_i1.p1 TRINITY_DN22490_c0_g2~~TRINITY_DN22490_c0_g2_i1.p1  ORF type:complete len:1116 (+),score=185.70 TRINITY_DN22490_c0_g2_i1:422-3349(+)
MGLDTRFPYLFDSPQSHSRATPSALASQLASEATAEDDAERIRMQWDDFEEWQSLTQALEQRESELRMWKAKAQELEEAVLHQQAQHAVERRKLTPEYDINSAHSHRGSAGSVHSGGSDAGTLSADRTPTARASSSQTKSVSRTRSASWANDDGGLSSLSSPHLAWHHMVVTAMEMRRGNIHRQAQGLRARRLGHCNASNSSFREQVSVSVSVSDGATDSPASCEACDEWEEPQHRGHSKRSMRKRGMRSYSMPGLGVNVIPFTADIEGVASDVPPRSPSPEALIANADGPSPEAAASPEECCSDGETFASPPGNARVAAEVGTTLVRKRAPLHVAFDGRRKANFRDGATQTAPAITLSKMYGGMVPRYIQRELARLRQENQILRYRVVSLAMSQPLNKPRPVRHQATQTAPAITFSARGSQGSAAGLFGIPRPAPAARLGVGSAPPVRLDVRDTGAMPHETLVAAYAHQKQSPPGRVESAAACTVVEPRWLPSASLSLEESVHAFLRSVDAQTLRLQTYIGGVRDRCRRTVQTLWPRSSVELYGSFASGLALPSSGLDLVIYPHRDLGRCLREDDGSLGTNRSLNILLPIDEDHDQLRQLPLDEVSPGHPSAAPSLASGWQQLLSCRLAQERWVRGDSIRVTALAAIPVLSMITTPEASPATVGATTSTTVAVEAEDPLSCSIVVDITLEDPNHRALRSKAFLNWLLNEYTYARPVTLVLKQWLIERTFGTSHTGGLCSYGLLLMVVAFLQRHPQTSASAALVGFLDFYGSRYDPQTLGVSVARCAFLDRKSPSTWPPVQAEYVERGFSPGAGEFASLPRKLSLTGEEAHRFDPLWIEDPLNPTNNVGRNCFRLRQIQRAMARAAETLTTASPEAAVDLRAILRFDGLTGSTAEPTLSGACCPDGEVPGVSGGEPRWAAHAKHALHGNLYRSLVEPNMMPAMPVRAQLARSHLPQQWDSAVRYAARAPSSRSRC